jgi:hypothetical protein
VVDFSKLTREDWMVGGGGILLFIFLLILPWYTESALGYSASQAATSSPYAIWGVLALIATIVVVADWALETFSPQTQLPTTQLGRAMTRASLAGLAFVLLLIKLIAHTGNWGWGFYVDMILSIVVVYGAWAAAQGKSTPVHSGSTTL